MSFLQGVFGRWGKSMDCLAQLILPAPAAGADFVGHAFDRNMRQYLGAGITGANSFYLTIIFHRARLLTDVH